MKTKSYLKLILLFGILLTGCRKDESAKLQWSDIDLTDKSYILRDPKNGRAMQLPLSDYLVDMLLNTLPIWCNFTGENHTQGGKRYMKAGLSVEIEAIVCLL